MPISDEYLVSYLLQETRRETVRWRCARDEGGVGYTARMNGVLLKLERIESTTESRLWLRLESEEGSALVPEPLGRGLWGRRYGSDTERALADCLQRLEQAVAAQSRRRAQAAADPARREALFRRIVMAGPAAE